MDATYTDHDNLEEFPTVVTLVECSRSSMVRIDKSFLQVFRGRGIIIHTAHWTGNDWQVNFDPTVRKVVRQSRVEENLYVSTVHLYSDCVLFFCRDIEQAITMYSNWATSCMPCLSTHHNKPRATIFTPSVSSLSTDTFARSCSLTPKINSIDGDRLESGLFEMITMLPFPFHPPCSSLDAIFRDRDLLWHQLYELAAPCRLKREESGTLWSYKNLIKLYQHWCTMKSLPDPVQILTAKLSTAKDWAIGDCKGRNDKTGIATLLIKRLELLLYSASTAIMSTRDATPVLASILAHHATSSEHWSDKDLFLRQHFNARYLSHVDNIFSRSNRSCHWPSVGSVSEIVLKLQDEWTHRMKSFAKSITRQDITRNHISTIRTHRQYLARLPSYASYLKQESRPYYPYAGGYKVFESRFAEHIYRGACATCILQDWVILLPCKHGLCNLCLRATGVEESSGNIVLIKECPICDYNYPPNGLLVRFDPPTAAGRTLSLDGGGVRGIVQMQLLFLIERNLDLNLPLSSFFDLIVGTSIGGICALGLGKRGWTADECRENFVLLTRKVFASMSAPEEYLSWLTNGWYGVVRNALKLLTTDSLYNTKSIESVLQNAFGSSPVMISSRSYLSEPRVAVITDETTSSTCKILPSYNVTGLPERKQYMSPAEYFRFTVWEAARCTSAAPSYWLPKEIGSSTYQDGGLDWNNPTVIARKEAQTLFPFNIASSVLVSVGCGQTETTSRIGRTSFLWRIWRSFNDKIDAEKQHETMELISGDSHRNVYRINPCLNIAEVQLDDVESIPALQSAVLNTMQSDCNLRGLINEVSQVLLASLFYLELRENKRLRGVHCRRYTGALQTRLTRKELETFRHKYVEARIDAGGKELLKIDIPLTIAIPTTKEREKFHINLVIGCSSHPISGSPYTVERLREAQRDFLPLTNVYCRKRKLGASFTDKTER